MCTTHLPLRKTSASGFVNTDRIFRESNPAKAAQTKLEQEFSKREKELDDSAAQIKNATEKFEREAPTLPESQRSSRQRQLVEMDRDFQRRRREFQEDLGVRKNEELQTVIERANRVIKQVAESEKFDLVIQEAVYINPSMTSPIRCSKSSTLASKQLSFH